MEERSLLTLEAMSNGILTESFIFQVSNYSYVEKRMNTPMDSSYFIPVSHEEYCDATCAISMSDGALEITIEDLNLGRSYYPKSFRSKIYPHRFNMSGKKGDDFRMLIVPFEDMSSNNHQNNIRAEFIFDKEVLSSICFNVSVMDENYHVFETELRLYGNIIE